MTYRSPASRKNTFILVQALYVYIRKFSGTVVSSERIILTIITVLHLIKWYNLSHTSCYAIVLTIILQWYYIILYRYGDLHGSRDSLDSISGVVSEKQRRLSGTVIEPSSEYSYSIFRLKTWHNYTSLTFPLLGGLQYFTLARAPPALNDWKYHNFERNWIQMDNNALTTIPRYLS